jgi:hypothetical protein
VSIANEVVCRKDGILFPTGDSRNHGFFDRKAHLTIRVGFSGNAGFLGQPPDIDRPVTLFHNLDKTRKNEWVRLASREQGNPGPPKGDQKEIIRRTRRPG